MKDDDDRPPTSLLPRPDAPLSEQPRGAPDANDLGSAARRLSRDDAAQPVQSHPWEAEERRAYQAARQTHERNTAEWREVRTNDAAVGANNGKARSIMLRRAGTPIVLGWIGLALGGPRGAAIGTIAGLAWNRLSHRSPDPPKAPPPQPPVGLRHENH